MSDFTGGVGQKDQSNKKQRLYAYVGVIAVILLALMAGIYAYTHKAKNADQPAAQTNQPAVTPAASTSTNNNTGSVAQPTKIDYGAAVNKYPYRIQFSQCHGTPGTLNVKKGTIVMLDNRDAVAHTIKADKQTFKIAGYDYALMRTSSVSNTNITCDGGGAAVLNVQN